MAQADLRGVDFIIMVLNKGNFDQRSDVRLSFSETDLHLLAGKPAIWSYEKYFIYPDNMSFSNRIYEFLASYSAFVGSREVFYARWKEETPISQHIFYYGNFYGIDLGLMEDDLGSVWEILNQEDYKDKRKKNMVENLVKVTRRLDPSFATFNEFMDNTMDYLNDTGIKLFFVVAPTKKKIIDKALTDEALLFSEAYKNLEENESFKKTDLSNSIPPEEFQKKGAHFNESGHFHFANLLYNELKDDI